MNKIKAYFKGEASKKAYLITFSVSLALLVLVGITIMFGREVIFNENNYVGITAIFVVVILILGFATLKSQDMYFIKRKEDNDFEDVQDFLTEEWQNVTFDYYATDIPEVVKPLCYDIGIEAKIIDKTIYIRCIECNGRYCKEMQTTDYAWFNKYFEIEA